MSCVHLCPEILLHILGEFANLRNASISLVMSVLPSVLCTEQLGSHAMEFHEILNLIIFRKCVEIVQVSLKSDEKNGYFTEDLCMHTHTHTYTHMIIYH